MTDQFIDLSNSERLRLSVAGHGLTQLVTEARSPAGDFEETDSEIVPDEDLGDVLSEFYDISDAALAKIMVAH